MRSLNRLSIFVVGKVREEDKRLHFIWSFWLMVSASLLWPELTALYITLFIGFLKEVWDELYGSGFCFYDLIANLLGCLTALYLIRLLALPFFES